jgi:glycosyltransferase involved in cell wall biosynthesis
MTVSCILSTRDRPQFLRQAIRCFERQTVPDRELIVVDGGDDPVEELCAGRALVRYVRAGVGAAYGTCLNIAAQHARGAIVQVINDDDYYAPAFLATSVSALESAPGNVITAWDCFLVLLRGDRRLRFSGHGWAAGATLCFRRALWERTPFRDGHSDAHFLADSGAEIARVHAPELYVLVRHGANSWQTLGDDDVEAYFRSLPPSGVSVESVVDAADLAFYEALMV